MATKVIYRGEDKLIEITLKDKNTGAAIDLNTVTGIQCYLLDSKNDSLDKYSLNGESGFSALTVSDASNGKFQVRLQSAKTISAGLGYYNAEVKIQRTDANYANSTKHDVTIIANIIEIKDSISKTDTNLLS